MTEVAPPRTTQSTIDPGLMTNYRRDHQNPVNHFLHVAVGWPIASIGVILLPFRPAWGIGLFLLAYAIMFFGHFVFEGNSPTILRRPATPFIVAASVVRRLYSELTRLASPTRAR